MSRPRTAHARRPPQPASAGSSSALRFAARARRQRVRRVLVALGSLVVAGAVAAAVWLVGWSDVLAMEDIRVEGASGSLAASVVEVADPPLGTPLVRVDTDAMAERVRSLPEIAAASVERSWPRAVTVSVTPRVPVAAVADGDTWRLIDESGVLFGNVATQPADVPVVDVPLTADASETRAAAASVLTGLPTSLRSQIDGVSAESEADVRLSLSSGATVLWGGSDRGAEKAAALLTLLAQEAETYDVSAPDRPAIQP
jgi:cell division protein FtsQ